MFADDGAALGELGGADPAVGAALWVFGGAVSAMIHHPLLGGALGGGALGGGALGGGDDCGGAPGGGALGGGVCGFAICCALAAPGGGAPSGVPTCSSRLPSAS